MPPNSAAETSNLPGSTLVDSHCHLDFPDFAGELDALVARAQAAGLARIVTISTRVKRHGEVLAIAERFPDVYCSVGTHPHHAHEELDVTVDELNHDYCSFTFAALITLFQRSTSACI